MVYLGLRGRFRGANWLKSKPYNIISGLDLWHRVEGDEEDEEEEEEEDEEEEEGYALRRWRGVSESDITEFTLPAWAICCGTRECRPEPELET